LTVPLNAEGGITSVYAQQFQAEQCHRNGKADESDRKRKVTRSEISPAERLGCSIQGSKRGTRDDRLVCLFSCLSTSEGYRHLRPVGHNYLHKE